MKKLKAYCVECGSEWLQSYPDDAPDSEPAATLCNACIKEFLDSDDEIEEEIST